VSEFPYAELAVVRRSGFVESRHFGSLVGLGADGAIALSLGDADAPVLPRSSAKPIQALACLEAGAPLAGPSLAIAAGSHTGEDEHVALVRKLLAVAGLDEQALGCPPDLPEDADTRRRLQCADEPASRIRMNCSGKHAAMLAASVQHGWPVESYLEPEHPLQQQVRASLERTAGEAVSHVAVDGCGAPLFGITLAGLARSVRALVTAAPGSPERAVADAMREHPFFVGGTGHVNTEVMRLVPGTVCKGGAEGVIVAAHANGAAVAVKVIDGSPRATTVLALAALNALGVDTEPAAGLRTVPVLGAGRPVGAVELGGALARALA
jgi:L-asparaginase II